MKKNTVLITGASSGIGRCTALALARDFGHLRLVARRSDRLQEIKQELEGESNARVDIYSADLSSRADLKELDEQKVFEVDALVNNAGVALGKDDVVDSNPEDWQKMWQLNIEAAFLVAQKCLKFMIANGGGDIVNVSSIAGHEAYAGGAIYCSTKAALRSFSQALRKETHGKNVRIMLLSPGMVETEFSRVRFKGDKKKAQRVYEGMSPLSPQDMADQIQFMLSRPRNVCMDEVLVLATDQAGATSVSRS